MRETRAGTVLISGLAGMAALFVAVGAVALWSQRSISSDYDVAANEVAPQLRGLRR